MIRRLYDRTQLPIATGCTTVSGSSDSRTTVTGATARAKHISKMCIARTAVYHQNHEMIYFPDIT